MSEQGCASCGTPMPAAAVFCPECGTSAPASPETPDPAVPVVGEPTAPAVPVVGEPTAPQHVVDATAAMPAPAPPAYAPPVPAPSGSSHDNRPAAALAFLAAAVVAVGSVLAWGTTNIAGVGDANGLTDADGAGTLLVALAGAGLALFMLSKGPQTAVKIGLVAAGALIVGIGVYDLLDVMGQADDVDEAVTAGLLPAGSSAGVGIGLWVAIVGGIPMAVAGILTRTP